jgi:hypothetical protein
MISGNEGTFATGRETGQRGGCWPIPRRCAICTNLIWFRPRTHKEPPDAPEPRYEWLLCKACDAALLVEMRRSSILSPSRLRIAIGLVAAERSPTAYTISPSVRIQREFAWLVRFLIFIALLHLVFFAILFTVPK